MHIAVQVNGTSGKDPVAFAKSWLSAHEKSSQQLGKPFVVEEFGKNVYDRSAANIAKTRDPVFAAVYDALADSLKSNGVFRGTHASCWYMHACCKLHVVVLHNAPPPKKCTLRPMAGSAQRKLHSARSEGIVQGKAHMIFASASMGLLATVHAA